VAALEREVWGYTDGEDVVPPPVLIVSVKRGGILLGAFDEAGVLKGFVYSIPAVKDGTLTQWSRDRAIQIGVELIEWTYDPLQALNAHFNFTKLGVVVEDYEENIYGVSSSPLHRGSPTDRFVAEWRVNAPHVARRIEQKGLGLVRDASVATAPLVNPSRQAGGWLAPGPADLSLDAARLFVEIPVGVAELQLADPTLALEWRLATRAIFQHYFARRYRIVDFFLSRKSGRGHYLLAAPDAR
jgi:chorismate synthase